MKRKGMILLSAALLAAGCQPNKDNNKTLDFETIDVNFSVKTSGIELPAGTTFSIAATCTRGGESDVKMNGKQVSDFRVLDESVVETEKYKKWQLIKASDEDAVTALSGDHNFRFRAVSPAAETIGETVAVKIPAVQEYAVGVNSYLTLWAAKSVTTVIPDIELELSTPAAMLNLLVPIDIVEENVPATLKSIEISPAEDGASVVLAGEGSVDFASGEFTLGTTGRSSTLTVNFPEGGLKLEAVKTEVKVAVLPFTTPKGGFKAKFSDVNGKSFETVFLAQENDEGKAIGAGTVADVAISASGDGVEPVNFPVLFPVSKVDGVKRFTKDNQPRWISEGYWSCMAQPQAYAEWHQVSVPEHPSGIKQWRETVNSGNISTGGVKGIWTGDYYEFTIPVKKFAAGTKVEFKAPFYGRQQPVFWNLKYRDGEDWKTCNLHNEVCYDGKTAMECTFSLNCGPKVITEVMTLENEIKSGYLKIRIECADGSIQADVAAAVTREFPWVDGGKYQAPCYFWDKGNGKSADTGATPEVTAVSFSIVD